MNSLILSNIARHVALNSWEENYFISLLEYKNFRRGERLLYAGRISKVLIFVSKGCLCTYSVEDNGLISV